VTVSFLLEAAIIHWFCFRTPDETPVITGEIALGSFEFVRVSGDKQLYRGQFDLFVNLCDRIDASRQKQFLRELPRLQQAVEETVRRLRLADFTDLRLSRLKTRVQDRLNDELGFDAVEEVLVANLKITAFQPRPKVAQQSASPGGEASLDESGSLSAN
jgi:hypothetical protein